mmetsp:Transcript_23019/g.50372  ORF Transcript_23019/g.50372 Transcript_23019/m.50372 type:complete len:349 (-) Transcript_23019:617-1663(-)
MSYNFEKSRNLDPVSVSCFVRSMITSSFTLSSSWVSRAAVTVLAASRALASRSALRLATILRCVCSSFDASMSSSSSILMSASNCFSSCCFSFSADSCLRKLLMKMSTSRRSSSIAANCFFFSSLSAAICRFVSSRSRSKKGIWLCEFCSCISSFLHRFSAAVYSLDRRLSRSCSRFASAVTAFWSISSLTRSASACDASSRDSSRLRRISSATRSFCSICERCLSTAIARDMRSSSSSLRLRAWFASSLSSMPMVSSSRAASISKFCVAAMTTSACFFILSGSALTLVSVACSCALVASFSVFCVRSDCARSAISVRSVFSFCRLAFWRARSARCSSTAASSASICG